MVTNWIVNDAKGHVVGIFKTKKAAVNFIRTQCLPGSWLEKAQDGNYTRESF
jgi:hypothetical protein